jgi:hypothetical protein
MKHIALTLPEHGEIVIKTDGNTYAWSMVLSDMNKPSTKSEGSVRSEVIVPVSPSGCLEPHM